MARRPAFVESAEKPRMLVCAFAEVPGPSAVGARAEQVLLAFSGGFDVDALSLKSKTLTHIERVGAARMLRVPVPESQPGENTVARTAFVDRLGAFRRALTRQLDNDSYDVIFCLDLFAAAAALPSMGQAKLIVEVAEVPSVGFADRYPVSAADTDTRTEWELGERAALKAATLVIAPSRQAARHLSDRTDPRRIRAFPRLVDTRIFLPPTVEIDLGGDKTIACVGGRDGGRRGENLLQGIKLVVARVADAQFILVGSPGGSDAATIERLQTLGISDRCSLVDVANHHELQQVLCTADLVVVPGDDSAWAVPHRALEAMACGRAVIIAANDAACRDHIVADQHAKVVAATDPQRLAAVIETLANDASARTRLAHAAQRQAVRFDLDNRMQELAAILTEATGVAFSSKLPPLEEVTSPAPVSRAVPPTPAATSAALSSETESISAPRASLPPRATLPSVRVAPAAVVSSLPSVSPLIAPSSLEFGADFGEGPATTLADPPSLPEAAPVAADHLSELTDDTSERPRGSPMPTSRRPFVPASAVRGLSGEADLSGDVWAGDTMLDPRQMGPSPTAPVADKVKAAMLNTDSGSAAAPKPDTDDASASRRRSAGPVARSLGVAEASVDNDPWGLDTIADASPLPDQTRVPSQDRAVITHPPKSFLVEHGVGDLTAEDDEDRKPVAAESPDDDVGSG